MISILLAAAPTLACGTFAGEEPVQQDGERVLFRQDKEDEWTAFVEVQFSGGQPGVPFAWVIPVRQGFDLDTDVSVAAAGLFDALEFATAPRFVGPGTEGLTPSMSCDGSLTDVLTSALPDPNPSVYLGEAVVGPFDLNLVAGDDADAVLDWLNAEGYALPDAAIDPLQDYVDEGYDFLGVQLNSDVSNGAVETLVLGCGMREPTVPLKLTALGAAPQMPITAYVLGDERVVPSGAWKEVEPSFAGVFDTPGYEAQLRVDQAAAGGRAWTTEYAAPAPDLLAVLDPTAAETLGHGAYLTRFRAYVDPANMFDDPVFVADPSAPDIQPIVRPGFAEAGTPAPAGALGLLCLLAFARRR